MMITQTDLLGRLRLLRYGLVVVVVVTFLVALLAPYAAVRPYADAAGQSVQISDFLGTSLTYTIVVAVLAIIVYFAYQIILRRAVQS